MGELGFIGVEYDEKYGGGGADFLTTAVLCEEMARARCASLAMAVGVHTDMASPHLYWTGSEALKEKYLPAICRGEALTAIAVTEPGGGSDVAAIRTRAVRDGDHYVLNGSKMFITNGVMADLYFVAARIEPRAETGKRHRGISMFLVERSTPGFSVSRKLDKMGNRASDTAELAFQDMRVPAENLLGPGRRRLLRGHARLPARAAGGGAARGGRLRARPRGHHRLRPAAPRLRRPALAASR